MHLVVKWNFAFSRRVVKLLGLFFPGFGNFLTFHSLVLLAVQKKQPIVLIPYIAQATCVMGFPWFEIILQQLAFLQPPTLHETQAIHTH